MDDDDLDQLVTELGKGVSNLLTDLDDVVAGTEVAAVEHVVVLSDGRKLLFRASLAARRD